MKISGRFREAFLSVVLALGAAAALPATAAAVPIDFGDPDSVNPSDSLDGFQIGNYAKSFDWTNFYVLHLDTASGGFNEYMNGILSPENFTVGLEDPDLGDIINIESIGSRDGAVNYNIMIAQNKPAPSFVDSVTKSESVRGNRSLSQTPVPAALPLFATALLLGGFALHRWKARKGD